MLNRALRGFFKGGINPSLPIPGLPRIVKEARAPQAFLRLADATQPLNFLFLDSSFAGCGDMCVLMNVGLRDLREENGLSLAVLQNYVYIKDSKEETVRNYMLLTNSGASVNFTYKPETAYLHTTFVEEDQDLMLEYTVDLALQEKQFRGEMPQPREALDLENRLRMTAFRGCGLGFEEDMSAPLTQAHFHRFQQELITPQNLLFGCVNVKDKDAHMARVLSYIKGKHSGFLGRQAKPRQVSRYVGGLEVRLSEQEQKFNVIVAFESAPWCSKNLWPFLLLKTIMGKADSFSSGGPGKGMYSRAYEHLMNVVPSVQKVASVHMPFSDSGLFGLHLGGNAESYQELVQLTLRELNLLQTLSADEVARGKLILKRGLIENMEQQAPLLQEIATNAFNFGIKFNEYSRLIDAVSLEELREVVARMLKSRKTVVATAPARLVGAVTALLKKL